CVVTWQILFFFQAEDGIRDFHVTGVQTCALPILESAVSAKFATSGQDCLAANRFYIEQPIYGAFVEAFAEKVRALSIRPGLEDRSEERRVGKGCRWRWSQYHWRNSRQWSGRALGG